jgi:hypothetical protein
VRQLRHFGRFWSDLVIGDDWTIAMAVVVTLVVIWLVERHAGNWFWLMPIVVIATLAVSLRRSSRCR